MADLRTLQDFLRHRLGVDQQLRLHVFTTKDGRFQASLENKRDGGWNVEIHDDPVDAIWNVLVPFTMRRGPMTPPQPAPVLTDPPAQIDLEEAIAAAVDPLADLLG